MSKAKDIINGAPPHHNFLLDEHDREMLAERLKELNRKATLCVGNYVRLSNGEYRRIAYDRGNVIHTAALKDLHKCDESFYLGYEYMIFEGEAGKVIEKNRLVLTREKKYGTCWFFYCDVVRERKVIFIRPFVCGESCEEWKKIHQKPANHLNFLGVRGLGSPRLLYPSAFSLVRLRAQLDNRIR
jgi:hypothetical protein